MSKFTKPEKSWILYDVANSAFTMLISTTIPIFFRSLAEQDVSASTASGIWALTTSVAVLILAVLSPFLGALADYKGMKKKMFSLFLVVGVIGLLLLSFSGNWISYMILFVITRIGYSACNIFYDSMLVDVTADDRMDRISSYGYALGYIGSCIPFIIGILLILVRPFGLSTQAATQISFVITALWWVAFTIPLLTSYKQVHYRATAGQAGEAIRGTFAELGSTFRAIRKNKPLWMFMIAFFFYIDAVNTVISMSTSYGTQLGIDSTQLVVALLVTQFVAFPCSIIYGKLAGRFGSKTMITAAVVAYMCIVFFAAFFLRAALEFWILAILVGMFQGGIQALSRSYYGKIIPKDHANEYYGFYDIFGKTASIIGTFLVATTTSLTGNASIGVLSIAILLAVALVFLLLQKDPTKGSTEAATVD